MGVSIKKEADSITFLIKIIVPYNTHVVKAFFGLIVDPRGLEPLTSSV